MPKSVRRAGRRRAIAARSRTPSPDGAGPRSDSPARRDTPDPRGLLDRILDAPHLAQAVPRLPPEVLHRIIQRCGLEDCGALVALATPGQLAQVFDLDLWGSRQPGRDEQFDADRFGVWLEVLMESGATAAARTLAGIDVDLVIAALAQHAIVFDGAAVSSSPPMDGEEAAAVTTLGDGLDCEVGGYLVVARRADSWEAIVAVLASLDAEHHDYFHRVMSGCRSLSNSGFEVDGLDDLLTASEQAMFDLAFDREQRREKLGYVTPAQARAFLQMSRQLRLDGDSTPPGNPVARAYFRAIEWPTAASAHGGSRRLPAASGAADVAEGAAAVAAVVELLDLLDLPDSLYSLHRAGVVAPPRELPGGPEDPTPRLALIQAHMQFVCECDRAAYSMRSQEIAYLANTIMAGCSIQSRPFTAQEASDAAVAVCNLGLENWAGTALPDDFLVGHDLPGVFQVGWTVLHDDVSQYAAEQLIGILARLRCDDREIQAGLDSLRIELARHWRAGAPWRARDALEVIMILDMPAWAALLGLIDECPVMHAGIGASRRDRTRAVSASAFEFISENSQIESVRAFMQSLPETLRR